MSSVPVLMYHHVAWDREITPKGFQRQLQWLKDNDFQCLSSEALLAHLSGTKPASKRSVVITFDDGYADNWVYAFPLLKKYQTKAIIFVVTGCVGAANGCRPTSLEGGKISDTRSAERAPGGFLNWDEIKAMADSGLVEIGSHTHTHRGFGEQSTYEDLARELRRSREEIESHINLWSAVFAWPWGDFRNEWLPLLPATGYRMAFTTRVGPNRYGTDPFQIERFKVQQEDAGWLKRRLWLYNRPFLAKAYSKVYGLDRRIKGVVRKHN